jgi:hypothetical protein
MSETIFAKGVSFPDCVKFCTPEFTSREGTRQRKQASDFSSYSVGTEVRVVSEIRGKVLMNTGIAVLLTTENGELMHINDTSKLVKC